MYEDFVNFFFFFFFLGGGGGHHITELVLGIISMHFMAFSEGQIGNIFRGY